MSHTVCAWLIFFNGLMVGWLWLGLEITKLTYKTYGPLP
jgi:hypothetical protein